MVRKTAIVPNVPKEEPDNLGSLGSPQPQPVEIKKGKKKVIYYESESDEEEEEEAPTIQRKKVVKQPITPAPIIEPQQPLTPKPKKVMTEKQLEALRRGQELRLLKAQEKREQQKQIEEEERKRREDLIVKKALSIKKKQLKKQEILDEISDDETPIEELPKRKPPVPRTEPKQKPQQIQQKPKFYFV
jgi:hypothetical protein